MLIVLPLGVLAMAVIFDVLGFTLRDSEWFDRSYWMIAAGVLAGLLATVFGVVDYLAIPSGTRARAVGRWHGGGNIIVVLLFAASWYLRWPGPQAPPGVALTLSFIGGGCR